MCYVSGALAKFNPAERLVGRDNYKRLDPLMSASERDLDKRLSLAFDPYYIQNQQAQQEQKSARGTMLTQDTFTGNVRPPRGARPNPIGTSLLGG